MNDNTKNIATTSSQPTNMSPSLQVLREQIDRATEAVRTETNDKVREIDQSDLDRLNSLYLERMSLMHQLGMIPVEGNELEGNELKVRDYAATFLGLLQQQLEMTDTQADTTVILTEIEQVQELLSRAEKQLSAEQRQAAMPAVMADLPNPTAINERIPSYTLHGQEVGASSANDSSAEPAPIEPKSILSYLSTKTESRVFIGTEGWKTFIGAANSIKLGIMLSQRAQDFVQKKCRAPIIDHAATAVTFRELIGLQATILGGGEMLVAIDVLFNSSRELVHYEHLGRLVVKVDKETGFITGIVDKYDARSSAFDPNHAAISSALAHLLTVVMTEDLRGRTTRRLTISGTEGELAGTFITDCRLTRDSGALVSPSWVSVVENANVNKAEEAMFEVYFGEASTLESGVTRKQATMGPQSSRKVYPVSDIYQACKDIRTYLMASLIPPAPETSEVSA